MQRGKVVAAFDCEVSADALETPCFQPSGFSVRTTVTYCDPYSQERGRNGLFCNGDPVNSFDPDGRCGGGGSGSGSGSGGSGNGNGGGGGGGPPGGGGYNIQSFSDITPSIFHDINYNSSTGGYSPYVANNGQNAQDPSSGVPFYLARRPSPANNPLLRAYYAGLAGYTANGAGNLLLRSLYAGFVGQPAGGTQLPYYLASNPNALNVIGRPNAANNGTDWYGSIFESIGTVAGFVGTASDAAQQLYGFKGAIGTNGTYYSNWTGNGSVETLPITEMVGNITFGVSVFTDFMLAVRTNPQTGQAYQSWGMFTVNTAVNGTAWYVGGPAGMGIGGGYQMMKQGVTQPFIGNPVGPGTPEAWANAQYNAQALKPINSLYPSF